MNREIKFRAKCDDKWVYGGGVFTFSKIKPAKTLMLGQDSNGNPLITIVDPETVGEFTGLSDRHGKELWEGDIVKTGDERIGVVEYHAFNSCGFSIEVKDHGSYSIGYTHYGRMNQEVIGDIYSNPELLEGK